LVQHYLRRFNRELNRQVEGLSLDALAALRRYSWPGNVRELQSVLKQALLQATGPVLVKDFLPESLLRPEAERAGSREAPERLEQFIENQLQAGAENLYEEALRRLDKLLLTRVLQHTGGNQLQAAKILGITRGSVRNKLRELGINIGRTVSDANEPEA
jgi:two-component system nitrogen regulation response regulator GlnG